MKALSFIAPVLPEEAHVVSGFHALRRHFEPKVVAQGDDGADDGRVICV